MAGVYIAAMKLELKAVFYAYWIITTILICIFMFMSMRNDYLRAKMTAKGGPDDNEVNMDRNRRKHIKYLLLVLIPFLFTLIGDTVYLLLLKDSGVVKALTDIFS